MSKKDRIDPRVKRTRKYLQESLLALLMEKDFQQISIAEITDRAELARPTFYLHFNSKEDLLSSYLDTLFEDYLENMNKNFDQENLVLAVDLFRQIHQNKALVALTRKTDITLILMQKLQDYIRHVLQLFIEKNIIPARDLNPDIKEFAISSMAGSSHAIILLWIQKDFPYTPEEMGFLFMELIRPGLTNVLMNNSLDGIFPG